MVMLGAMALTASFAMFEMQIVLPEVLRSVTPRPASRRRRRVDGRAGAGLG